VPELRVVNIVGPERKVACHYAEQILSGEIGVRDPGLIIEPVATS
jgi:hypothetical protein